MHPERATTMPRPSKSHADTVLLDHESVAKSAAELVNRLSILKTAVFGPEPEQASGAGIAPTTSGFFPRLADIHDGTKGSIDRAHEIVTQLEQRFGAQ